MFRNYPTNMLLIFTFLTGCATSTKEHMSQFSHQSKSQPELEQDYQTCSVAAYNAGYIRKGGLLGGSGRLEFIENCLVRRGWHAQNSQR